MSESPWDKRTIEELEAWLYGPRSLGGATREWFVEEAKHWADGMSLLDIGCGGGVTAYQLGQAGILDRLDEYWGVDGSFKMLELAQKKCGHYKNVSFGWENLAFLPGRSGTGDPDLWAGRFDRVLLRAVLEHNRDPLPILRGALRTMARYGTLYIIWWNNPVLGDPIELPEAWGIPDIAHTKKPLLDYIAKAGRKVEIVEFPENDARGNNRQVWIIA